MDFKKFGIVLAVLLFAGMALAATPDINIARPTTGQSFEQGTTVDINFTVNDSNGALDFNVDLYYSASAGAYTTLIVHDGNLKDAATITCFPDYNFQNGTDTCKYSWNTTNVKTGNYFIDANFIEVNTTLTNESDNASGGQFLLGILPISAGACNLVSVMYLALIGVILILVAIVVIRIQAGGGLDSVNQVAIGLIIVIIILAIIGYVNQEVCVNLITSATR